MTTTYDRVVEQIRTAFIKDADGRFRVGVLVGKALAAGGSIKALVDDVGISRNTLLCYQATADFWGEDRMPPDAEGRPTCWSDYVSAASFAADMTDAEAAAFRRQMVKGGREEFHRWRKAKWNERQAQRAPRYDPHAPMLNALRSARWHLSNVLGDEDGPPLSALDRRKVRDILREMVAEAETAGISLAAPIRRGRAA